MTIESNEQVWYIGHIAKIYEHYWLAKLEGAHTNDPRYKVYIHRSVVSSGFGSAIVGTKVKFRLAPNRKQGDEIPWWNALEAIPLELEPIPEVVEAIVASFSNTQGRGTARIIRKFKRPGFAIIRIDRKDVITAGELYEGRLIRCGVAPPDPDGTIYNAREIEIYEDLTALP